MEIVLQYLAFLALIGVTMGLPLLLVVGFIRKNLRNSKKETHVRKFGKKTTAKVLSVYDTGEEVNNYYYIKITLELAASKKTVATEMLASRIAIPRVGDIIEVLYDPANPENVILA